MKLEKIVIASLLGGLTLISSANAQVRICESDGNGMPAKLEFRPFAPGRQEALVMEYQGRNVLKDPLSVFNHMGIVFFRGESGITFNAYEDFDEFYVTVSVFGGQPVVTARGHCRPKE